MRITDQQKTPMLTVVIPVYNGESYIEETLKAVLCSEYFNIEVMLIDDGSLDGSASICQRYEKMDGRVRYVRIENGGIVAARNKGMELATGEYICFCDQDDIIESFMYQEVLNKMIQNDAQIGMCSTGRWIDGDKSIYERLTEGCYMQHEILEYLLYPLLFRGYRYPFVKQDNYLYGTVWKCIFNRQFLVEHKLQFRRFVNYEDDWIFVTQALAQAQCAVTIKRIGYYWRVNSMSESHKEGFQLDIFEKFVALDAYVFSYLSERMEEDILIKYKQIALCEHYADGYRNLSYAKTKQQRQIGKIEIKQYLINSSYKEQLSCLKYLQNTAFRKKILYTALQYCGIRCTFLINKILLLLEKQTIRMQWFVSWERNKKLKK